MFCPECGGEYRSGFTVCADCDVPLVESLEELPAAEPAELELLLTTRDPEELGHLAELLEEAEVPYLLHAGTALALAEGGRLDHGRPDGWEARLLVHGPRLAEGQRLLAGLVAARRRASS